MSCPINPLIEECKRLRKSVLPISERYHGVTDQISAKNTMYPFVLLLGNHSSGKSSFINHILKRKVQTTGVAPTDDNFTIIGPGEADIDRNGPALVGDPDLGFSELKTFGPVLVNHTQLKVRCGTAINDFMIVDSPGMIDSPVTDKTPSDGPVGMDRGYNFEGVCRWYAERADVILLFFDPDKPGTTGETLSILTTALVGLDHKLYIILNKADQFHRIHDFARAYGSLCWNLSKVIPRKDLPRIHTMCLPAKAIAQEESTQSVGNSPLIVPANCEPSRSPVRSLSPSPTLILKDGSYGHEPFISASSPKCENPTVTTPPITTSKTFFEQGSSDLEESRAEIELEMFNAPRRRIDNEISRLTEAISALLMHCNIIDKVREVYENKMWRARGLSAVMLVASVGLTIGANYLCDALLSSSPTPATDCTGATMKEALVANKAGTPATKSSSATGGNTLRSTRAGSAVVTASVIGSYTGAAERTSAFDAMWNWRSKLTIMGWTAVTGILSTIGVVVHEHYTMKAMLETFNSRSTYENLYRHIYSKEIDAKNEAIIAIGKVVLDAIPANVNAEFIQKMRRVEKVEFTALHRILNEDIPNLRRRASPSFPVLEAPILTSPWCSADNLVGLSSSPSSEHLDRVPYKSHRASVHPNMHVHFSPSTNCSPVTTRDNNSKKKNVILLGFNDSTAITPDDFAAYQVSPLETVSNALEATEHACVLRSEETALSNSTDCDAGVHGVLVNTSLDNPARATYNAEAVTEEVVCHDE